MLKQTIANNITQPDKYGYQVRVVRRKKEYSRYFSFKLYGSKNKALDASKSWRDQVIVVKKSNIRRLDYPLANNVSTGICGVCRTTQHDKRKNLTYLVFGVRWVDYKRKVRTKSFRVGNVKYIDKVIEDKAFRAAIEFRKEWEYHADNDTLHLFDVNKYMNWRNTF